ncbi:MAG TPA: hypothetical protein VM370_10820 [Candidatus Thermoplasmatota archaeon]|nr:hypothetical protein [Candidatus Thermoplasmatota archaeon]
MTTPLPGVAGSPPYPQSPIVEKSNAILCLVINVFLPGIGTIVGGVMGNKPLIGRGIAQLLLSLIIVGWVWALVTGVQMLQNATWNESPMAVRPA